MADDQLPSVVIDHGSDCTKAGLGGEDAPRAVFPTMIGRPKNSALMITGMTKDAYIGDEAMSKRGILRLSYPYRRGLINDWDGMEKLWHYTFFNEIRVDPSEHRVLLTETISTPKCQWEQMCEIMFEDFVPLGVSVVNRQVLACYAQGLTSGLSVSLGHSNTAVAAVYEGAIVYPTAGINDVGGEALTSHLRQQLEFKGYSFTTSAELMIVADMKRCCQVALEYEKEMRDNHAGIQGKMYELPDGQVIDLSDAVFSCPEAYFRPERFLHIRQPSLPQMIISSFRRCDETTKKAINGKMVVSGGSALFGGMQDRLKSELNSLLSPKEMLQVKLSPHAKYDTWIGGSVLASLQSFVGICLSKEEFDADGAVRLYAKLKN